MIPLAPPTPGMRKLSSLSTSAAAPINATPQSSTPPPKSAKSQHRFLPSLHLPRRPCRRGRGPRRPSPPVPARCCPTCLIGHRRVALHLAVQGDDRVRVQMRVLKRREPLRSVRMWKTAASGSAGVGLLTRLIRSSLAADGDHWNSTLVLSLCGCGLSMPDAVVDYNLSNGKWLIVQQQNLLHDRTKTLYGTAAADAINRSSSIKSEVDGSDVSWNELSEFYACEYYDVPSKDEVMVPLTIAYSRKNKQEGSPGLLHGHGAYGELLDKRWRSELKSLLDRGWVVAYADVRGGGGSGKKWHYDGRCMKKQNSISDYISCAEFLIEKGIVEENKLAVGDIVLEAVSLLQLLILVRIYSDLHF